ncbi:uncharacterized protein ASPGLDRAFT_50343 [Aspergillus glaucus CBS 516.65]|uniref:Uncharacterized protein n=1 Tax=Aspergillus glaucus CBS 516.65 TaxID=1160497 RepID=A0A1L9VBL2_ASPGL|nr:hypothetical protein ASPGLDRAFT_50343 [Aspergillus glaucus CBS 516.65]OJJ81290.1 hypothetical protein ASPGLDRAFT_50343 [Aspergillus glaucus CBS 516.65]
MRKEEEEGCAISVDETYIPCEMGIGGRRSGGVDYPRLARSYTERSSFNKRSVLPIKAYTHTQLVKCLSACLSKRALDNL